jgi:hypothetical protein
MLDSAATGEAKLADPKPSPRPLSASEVCNVALAVSARGGAIKV